MKKSALLFAMLVYAISFCANAYKWDTAADSPKNIINVQDNNEFYTKYFSKDGSTPRNISGKAVVIVTTVKSCPPCKRTLNYLNRYINLNNASSKLLLLDVSIMDLPENQPPRFKVDMKPFIPVSNIYATYNAPYIFIYDRQGNLVYYTNEAPFREIYRYNPDTKMVASEFLPSKLPANATKDLKKAFEETYKLLTALDKVCR